MKLITTNKLTLLILATVIAMNLQAQESRNNKLTFVESQIVDSTKHWWAHCPGEINGDGIMDLIFINSNSSGGYLGYYLGQETPGNWKKVVVAEKTPAGKLFASGDLECADMDGDGDTDIFAVQHPGEWVDAGAPATLYWYENPTWEVHTIGTVPNAVKDVSFSDLNQDNLMDIAILTFNSNTLSIFAQHESGFERVGYWENYGNLHEGMYAGDVNGDGYPDLAANGWLFMNPKGDLKEDWEVNAIDEKWHNQEGDWSRNATKCFMEDLDGDGKNEVFIAHSERAGYPLSWYKMEDGQWTEHIIHDSIAACHTLQVFDFDLDGDFDVLAGVNAARAVNLGKTDYPIRVFLSSDNYQKWEPLLIQSDGIYNGQAADYDGDGDIDIFRYPNHEATKFYLWKNQIR